MKRFLKEMLNAPKPDDKVSASYLWFHIGNAAATFVFVRAGMALSKSDTPNLDGLAMLMLTYMGLITGNKIAIKFLDYKMQGGPQPKFTSVETSTTTVIGQTPVGPTPGPNPGAPN